MYLCVFMHPAAHGCPWSTHRHDTHPPRPHSSSPTPPLIPPLLPISTPLRLITLLLLITPPAFTPPQQEGPDQTAGPGRSGAAGRLQDRRRRPPCLFSDEPERALARHLLLLTHMPRPPLVPQETRGSHRPWCTTRKSLDWKRRHDGLHRHYQIRRVSAIRRTEWHGRTG